MGHPESIYASLNVEVTSNARRTSSAPDDAGLADSFPSRLKIISSWKRRVERGGVWREIQLRQRRSFPSRMHAIHAAVLPFTESGPR